MSPDLFMKLCKLAPKMFNELSDGEFDDYMKNLEAQLLIPGCVFLFVVGSCALLFPLVRRLSLSLSLSLSVGVSRSVCLFFQYAVSLPHSLTPSRPLALFLFFSSCRHSRAGTLMSS